MLAEKDPALRALRLGLVLLFRNKVAKLLYLLGIDIPERM